MWRVGEWRNAAFLLSFSSVGVLARLVSRPSGARCICSLSACSLRPPVQVWQLIFFPPFIIPPLLAAVWQCSASPLSDSCVCLFASLQRRIPQLFTRGPQLCWSSSTNQLIPDSITAVHTAPRSSCEAPGSCCFASLLLHKAPAGSRGTGAAVSRSSCFTPPAFWKQKKKLKKSVYYFHYSFIFPFCTS